MSVSLLDLWIPILLGGAVAWIASGLIHMVLKYHNSDYGKLANEDDVAASLRAGSVDTGFYSLPHCADMKSMNDEAMKTGLRKDRLPLLQFSQKACHRWANCSASR